MPSPVPRTRPHLGVITAYSACPRDLVVKTRPFCRRWRLICTVPNEFARFSTRALFYIVSTWPEEGSRPGNQWWFSSSSFRAVFLEYCRVGCVFGYRIEVWELHAQGLIEVELFCRSVFYFWRFCIAGRSQLLQMYKTKSFLQLENYTVHSRHEDEDTCGGSEVGFVLLALLHKLWIRICWKFRHYLVRRTINVEVVEGDGFCGR